MILAAITTCRRKPAMVERALRSVIAQTYTDWECVVVDDSPADYEFRGEVRKMVEGYAAQDSRIRYVPHDMNRGVSAARNTALNIAISTDGGGGHEFIAYLDDDDEWLPEKLEKQYEKFMECENNTGLVYCKCYVIDEDTGYRSITAYTSKKHEGKVYLNLLEKNFVNTMAMIRSKYLAEAGGFDGSMPALEDWEAWLKLAKLCKFAYLDEPLGNIHSGGDMAHVNTDDVSMLKALEMLFERHKGTLQKEEYLYWRMLGNILIYYPVFGEYRKFGTGWVKMVSLQPLRIFRNVLILLRAWIIFPLKKYINCKIPKLFFKLKKFKHKLKGDTEIDTN